MFVRKLLLLKSSFGKSTKSQINNFQGLFKKIPTSFLWPTFLSNHSSRTLSFSLFPTPHFPFSSTSSALPQSSIQRDWQNDFNLFKDANEWARQDVEGIRHVLTQYSACQDISTLPQEELQYLRGLFLCFGDYFSSSKKGYQYMEEGIRLSELLQDASLAQAYLNRFFLSYQNQRMDDLESWLEKAESVFLKHGTEETHDLDLGLKVAKVFLFIEQSKINEALNLTEELALEEDRVLQSMYALFYAVILQHSAEFYFAKGERKRAVELCKKLFEGKGTAGLNDNEGSVHQIMKLAQLLDRNREYSEAEIFANTAKKRFLEFLPEASWEVACCEAILGHISEKSQDFDRSLLCYEKALSTIEKLNPEKTEELEYIYCGLVTVYFHKLQDQKSVEAFKKFLELKQGKENLKMFEKVLEFCNLLTNRDETRKDAREFLDKAYDMLMSLKEKDYLTEFTFRSSYGLILKNEGNPSKANEILEKAEELVKKIPNLSPADIANVYQTRGEVVLELGDLPKSLDLFEKVIKLPGLNDPVVKIKVYILMIEVYNKLNKPEKVLETHLSLLELFVELYGKTDVKTVFYFEVIEEFIKKHQMGGRLQELKEKFEKM